MKEKEDGDAMLRDFQYSLRCQYMERARNLRVARIDFSWQLAVVVSVIGGVVNFDPDSVYGNRTGFQDVLIITSRDKNSVP